MFVRILFLTILFSRINAFSNRMCLDLFQNQLLPRDAQLIADAAKLVGKLEQSPTRARISSAARIVAEIVNRITDSLFYRKFILLKTMADQVQKLTEQIRKLSFEELDQAFRGSLEQLIAYQKLDRNFRKMLLFEVFGKLFDIREPNDSAFLQKFDRVLELFGYMSEHNFVTKAHFWELVTGNLENYSNVKHSATTNSRISAKNSASEMLSELVKLKELPDFQRLRNNPAFKKLLTAVSEIYIADVNSNVAPLGKTIPEVQGFSYGAFSSALFVMGLHINKIRSLIGQEADLPAWRMILGINSVTLSSLSRRMYGHFPLKVARALGNVDLSFQLDGPALGAAVDQLPESQSQLKFEYSKWQEIDNYFRNGRFERDLRQFGFQPLN